MITIIEEGIVKVVRDRNIGKIVFSVLINNNPIRFVSAIINTEDELKEVQQNYIPLIIIDCIKDAVTAKADLNKILIKPILS